MQQKKRQTTVGNPSSRIIVLLTVLLYGITKYIHTCVRACVRGFVVRRAVSAMASVSMRNSELFGLGETGYEKFRNMMEVIEATNDHLGVSLVFNRNCLPLP